MLVTLELATEVLKLRRQHVTVAKMAEALGRSETEILDAHCMLGIAIADRDDEPPRPRLSCAERAARRERLPKKWQDHYVRGKS